MKEIEYKFLVKDISAVMKGGFNRAKDIKQGYLTDMDSLNTVRIRQTSGNVYANIAVKGPSVGISRDEFEYNIPNKDADEMFALCGTRIIEKTRFEIKHNEHVIELDVFKGALAGLIIAEVEVASEDTVLDKPSWFGEDVSTDKRYTNSYLAQYGLSEPKTTENTQELSFKGGACRDELKENGYMYPRTCSRCGIGKCTRNYTNSTGPR